MTERKYICAFTALGNSYPQYMNFTRNGDEVEVTLRTAPTEDGREGQTVSLSMPAPIFAAMLEDANKNFPGK